MLSLKSRDLKELTGAWISKYNWCTQRNIGDSQRTNYDL